MAVGMNKLSPSTDTSVLPLRSTWAPPPLGAGFDQSLLVSVLEEERHQLSPLYKYAPTITECIATHSMEFSPVSGATDVGIQ